ncbi:Putative zinc metalloprotease Rip3 [Candidatus Thermoflexus japonica]|uniref:Zinc metalloprotease Rip3 n=1 Tax=Candidatus Thermoflexus japonica TaxID=2035417 RepID=A0A2H5Y735_9CHLR|nr:Putative zinc metalloprotease Rip3 [Candidatus Thermoflexus japonica]
MKSRSFTLELLTLAGTPVRVHWSLPALLAVAVLGAGALGGWREALRQGFGWGLLFGLVLLHEIGHLAAARLLRIPVSSILLWPLGGFTAVQLPAGRFGAELAIALAGPAVNLLIAMGLSAMGIGGGSPGSPGDRGGIWSILWLLNLLLGVFNLLPVFPLDGGRIMRSLLAMGFGEERGTQLALRVGQAGALGIGGMAVWQFMHRDAGGLVTMTVAMWLFGQTLQEARLLRRQEHLRRIPVAPYPQPLWIAINDRVALPAARRLLAHSGQPLLPVESAGQWAEGFFLNPEGIRRRPLRIVDGESSIAAAWSCLTRSEEPGLLVIRNGRPIGWLAREQVEALLQDHLS